MLLHVYRMRHFENSRISILGWFPHGNNMKQHCSDCSSSFHYGVLNFNLVIPNHKRSPQFTTKTFVQVLFQSTLSILSYGRFLNRILLAQFPSENFMQLEYIIINFTYENYLKIMYLLSIQHYLLNHLFSQVFICKKNMFCSYRTPWATRIFFTAMFKQPEAKSSLLFQLISGWLTMRIR